MRSNLKTINNKPILQPVISKYEVKHIYSDFHGVYNNYVIKAGLKVNWRLYM